MSDLPLLPAHSTMKTQVTRGFFSNPQLSLLALPQIWVILLLDPS